MKKFTVPETFAERSAAPDDSEPRLEFRFLLAGASAADEVRYALREELTELIANLLHLNLVPVNRGLQLDIEVDTTAPFDNAGFEAYLVDHVLDPVLNRAGSERPVSIRPLRARRG
ncbi:MAG: hypothetical protein AB8B93_01270 [Pseudomonadales bacterium]